MVETFGQLADVAYWDDEDKEQVRRFHFPPKFLASGTASVIHSAIEQASFALSLENLLKASTKSVVVYDEAVDCAKSNI